MSQGKTYLKQIIGFSLVLDIIIIDQIVKWVIMEGVFKENGIGLIDWIVEAPERLPFMRMEILPFFNLVMVWNEGVSFGLFSEAMTGILILVALLISAGLSVWLLRTKLWHEAIPLGMIIGGAIGNTIDRFRFGAVADFFDFHFSGWHYPAFNIADISITLGVAFLILGSLLLESKKES